MAMNCKTCGGQVNRVGDYYICDRCRKKWEINGGDDVCVVECANKSTAFGVGGVKNSISEKQMLSLICIYLEERQWQDAIRLADDILLNNPDCAEAIWCKLLATHRASTEDELVRKMDHFTQTDYSVVAKVLNSASVKFAERILMFLYGCEKNVVDATYKNILGTILPYSFSERQNCINVAFEDVIARNKIEAFRLLLTTLDFSDVDRYILYNDQYAAGASLPTEKSECLKNILKVDEGNIKALRMIMELDLINGKANNLVIRDLECLLKYTSNINIEIVNCLNWLCDHLANTEQCDFAKQLLQYYTDELSTLQEGLIDLSYRMIYQKLFKEAEYFLNLVLSFNANKAKVYWAICLMKIEATGEEEIVSRDRLLRDVPEFNKYLMLVDDARRKHCISISKRQVERKGRVIAERMVYLKEEINGWGTSRPEIGRSCACLLSGIAGVLVGIVLAVLVSETMGMMICVIALILALMGATSLVGRISAANNVQKIDKLQAELKELEQKGLDMDITMVNDEKRKNIMAGKKAILEILTYGDSERGMTITDMMRFIPECEGQSSATITKMAQELVDDGLLKQTEIKGRVYYNVFK